MKESTIRPGDVVELKSGGPNMTVTAVDENGEICVAWIDHGGTVHTASFHAACLLKI